MSIKVEYLGTYPIRSKCKKIGVSVFILLNGEKLCYQDKKGHPCETGITIGPENSKRIRELIKEWAENN